MQPTEIRSFLKALRAALGDMKQEDFAKALGVSWSTGSKWEAKKRWVEPLPKHYADMARLATRAGLATQARKLADLALAEVPAEIRALASGETPRTPKVDNPDTPSAPGDILEIAFNGATEEVAIWLLAFRRILESGHRKAVKAIKENIEAFDELISRANGDHNVTTPAYERAKAAFIADAGKPLNHGARATVRKKAPGHGGEKVAS